MIVQKKQLISQFSNENLSGFIVFEGINGAGKSTLLTGCSEYLSSIRKQHICTREPGGTNFGKELRTLLLEKKESTRTGTSEMFLFSADRAQHLAEIIRPSLEKGYLVLGDRYYYSTTAFQGYGRGLDLTFIAQCNQLATAGLEPDFVVLLDIDPKEALLRLAKRASNETDAFESEALAFHTRVREGFLKQAEGLSTPFLILDATKEKEELLSDMREVFQKLYIKENTN